MRGLCTTDRRLDIAITLDDRTHYEAEFLRNALMERLSPCTVSVDPKGTELQVAAIRNLECLSIEEVRAIAAEVDRIVFAEFRRVLANATYSVCLSVEQGGESEASGFWRHGEDWRRLAVAALRELRNLGADAYRVEVFAGDIGAPAPSTKPIAATDDIPPLRREQALFGLAHINARIEALRDAAREHGDHELVGCCSIALGQSAANRSDAGIAYARDLCMAMGEEG